MPIDPVGAYARAVGAGKVVAARLVRLACQRISTICARPKRGISTGTRRRRRGRLTSSPPSRASGGRPAGQPADAAGPAPCRRSHPDGRRAAAQAGGRPLLMSAYRSAPHVPPETVRTPVGGSRRCPVCDQSELRGRQTACSAACRRERSRRRTAEAQRRRGRGNPGGARRH
jgi:hypothetical protein